MGYTTVRGRAGAVAAAARLAELSGPLSPHSWSARLPLLLDQVMGEAGVYEPAIAARALDQAAGDITRACSLIRAWSAVLPRLGTSRAEFSELRVLRRITPGFSGPPGGQYLGASQDYAQRLLQLDSHAGADPNGHVPEPAESAPHRFAAARESLEREDLLAPAAPRAEPVDITRVSEPGTSRGALLQLLSRGESGAMTAIAYTAVRGFGALQDPTILELRSGAVPVRLTDPDGGSMTVGEVPITTVEIALYRMHGGLPDPRFTLGAGATLGRLERRAISAAVLDATTTRATDRPGRAKAPCEDAEFLAIALDGQEATGFVEHLKLPHHVTFTSDLDRVRAGRRLAQEGAEE